MSRPVVTANPLRRRPLEVALALAALLGAVYLIWQPATTDLAAQAFRADLWGREGFVIWNPDWYGGHTIPGYSLLYPPLGVWLGPALVGVLSAFAATWVFGRLALDLWGERAWLGVVWFALAPAAAIYSGRTTFALGLAIGLAALWAVHRRRPGWALVGGLLTTAASPVSGLFLLLACVAIALERLWPLGERRAELPVGAAIAAGVGSGLMLALLGLAFPTDGFQPFVVSSFIWIPLLVAGFLLLVGRREGALLWGVLLYGALGLGAVLVETPLGGNATRLGATFAGPLLAILLIRRRPLLLAAVALPLLWWQWTTALHDVAATVDDPSNRAAYYAPLLAELDRRSSDRAGTAIVHVPPTRNRWEAVHVAERYPITGGWLRQLESDDFDLFDDGPLRRREYLRWLGERGAAFVAVNDAEPDYLADSERALLGSGALDDLLVWSAGPWRLYEVAEPPRAQAARLLALEADSFTYALTGATSLPLRWTPYMEVAEGAACVAEDPRNDRRLLLTPAEPGPKPAPEPVRVEARLSLGAGLGRSEHCRGAG